MSKKKYLRDSLIKALEKIEELSDRDDLSEIERDAFIQRFEYTMELSWKYMKAYALEEGVGTDSPRSAIRMAAKLGMINDVAVWFEYLNLRNLASHTYMEANALKIVVVASRFKDDVAALISFEERQS